jgi:glycosyltransferase involved in cell wall biosynthesis
MRVAILGNYPSENFRSLPGGNQLPANTTHWNANLAKALVRHNQEVHVLCLAPGLRQNLTCQDEGVTVHWLALPQRARVATGFQWPRLLVQHSLAGIQPDIVHGVATEHEYPYLAQKSGYPYLIGVHVLVRDVLASVRLSRMRRFRLRIYEHLEKRVLEQSPFITITTPFLAGALQSRSRQRVFVIPNAISPRFEQMETQTNLDQGCKFLFVGRISPEKNIETLLAAFSRLHITMPDIRLDLVGKIEDSAYFASLHALITATGVKSAITFHGQMSSTSLARQMSKAHVLVLPSRYEAFGLVIAEAMSMGLPVIASRIGGIPHVVQDGVSGLLFDPDDQNTLVHHMTALARDVRTRRNLGTHGRIFARSHFSAHIVAEKTIAVYSQVLKSNHVFNELRQTVYALA